jgi:hypothetical protein
MGTPKSNKPSGNSVIDLISRPVLQGIFGLASMVFALISDNPIVQILSLIILLGVLIALRFVIWHWLKKIAAWLTWKFVLGVVAGILIGVLAFPFFQSIYIFGASYFVPQVEIVQTEPQSGGTLPLLRMFVKVDFSQRILPQYRTSPFIDIEITPNIPLNRKWAIDYDEESNCCRTLLVESAKYYPNSRFAQFEPNTTYHLRISGLSIKNPVDVEFHTPAQ